MKLGQIPENVYNRSVIRELTYKNEKIAGGADCRESCAFLLSDSDENNAAFTISKACNASLKELDGTLAIISAVNNLFAAGAKAESININLLMPHRFSEERLKALVKRYNDLATSLGVSISLFSGEMLNELTEAVVSVVAFGKLNNKKIEYTKNDRLDIILTKWVGLAGTVAIASNKEEELLDRFSAAYIDLAKDLEKYLSVKEEADIINKINNEAALAGKSDAIFMTSLSKGGIYKALWDIGEKCGTGLTVELKSVPIKQETVEICNYYDLNPYELYSEGSLLIVSKNGSEIVEMLSEHDIPARVIGHFTNDNDRVIINDYERKFLTKPEPDEMTKIKL